MEIAILGLGCFWGPERKFGEIDGVTNTEVGYCGGKNKDTNYQEVCTGTTGHACLLYTSPSPRDCLLSRMPSSA